MAAVAMAATRTAELPCITRVTFTAAGPSRRENAVADAADGLDADAGAGQLGPQPGQVDVDGVGAERVGLVVPDVQGDRAAVGDRGRAPHEDLQDAELGAGQGGSLAAGAHLAGRRVKLDLPDRQP